MGVIGTLGATALSTEMTTMSLELPMLTTAMRNKLNVDETKDFTCESFYKSYKLVSDADATKLCTQSQYFNFSDTMETSVALTNMYMYQGMFNPKYVKDYTDTLGIDPSTLTDLMLGVDKKFTIWFNDLQTQIYEHYNAEGVCNNRLPNVNYCAFSNLTNTQWLDQTVLKKPMPGQSGFPDETEFGQGYAFYYKDYVQNWITPEYGYWRYKNGYDPLEEGQQFDDAINITYAYFTIEEIYSQTIYQDYLLGLRKIPDFLPGMDEYLRFVTINFGLTGLIAPHTPREVIEGYEDPLIQQLNSMPIYMGGDITTSATLAMSNPPTHPTENRVAFFTGEEDYEKTRVYGNWLGQNYIMIKGKQYTSINKVEDYLYSPWDEPVLLDGTDGMQFSPDLSKDSTLKAFVNDLSRNCYFDYSHTDDRYPHLETYVYAIQEDLMRNDTHYAPNKNYQVNITGTSNMTSSLQAYAFVAKGHYFQMSDAVSDSMPIIVDQNDTAIKPDRDADDTYLGVE